MDRATVGLKVAPVYESSNGAMTLKDLGWDDAWQASFAEFREGCVPGRVAVEDKHQYYVFTANGAVPAEVPGKLLHAAQSPADLPKVGDWVALLLLPPENKGVIQHLLPRRTKLCRKVPGRETQEQVLVTNVDVVFIVQALDSTFNPRLLERMLLMVHESGAQPVIVLNKVDLADDLPEKVAEAGHAAVGVPIVTVSAKTGQAIEEMRPYVGEGMTVVFIGPSGVGKSSLINCLYGEEVQATTEVREKDLKGRHTTTWRELIVLPHGGVVIDTPGMREFQIWMAGQGFHDAFPDIEELAVGCHFRNCTHVHEKRCAVQDALAAGKLPRDRYNNYLKLRHELDFLEEAQHKHAWIERKRKTKVAQRAFNQFKRSSGGHD
jgi:ribosome biogenesis GTPase / thiamine phosphate phosphatase